MNRNANIELLKSELPKVLSPSDFCNIFLKLRDELFDHEIDLGKVKELYSALRKNDFFVNDLNLFCYFNKDCLIAHHIFSKEFYSTIDSIDEFDLFLILFDIRTFVKKNIERHYSGYCLQYTFKESDQSQLIGEYKKFSSFYWYNIFSSIVKHYELEIEVPKLF